jgi:predicted glycosyltransferase
MKILIDIGHPAHVHYYRNFIKIMESKEHSVFVVARERENVQELLTHYGIKYKSRGRGKNSLFGKILYLPWANSVLLFWSLIYKPDMYVSHGSPYLAQIAWLLGKPAVCTGDSDHVSKKYVNNFVLPFLTSWLNPIVYKLEFGRKQIRFNSYMEIFHLHPKYYKMSDEILKKIHVNKTEKYFVLRFVSWDAFHDVLPGSINDKFISELIQLLSKYGKIIISSEKKLSLEFEKYRLNFPSHEFHNLLANAEMCIGEGATTAAEAAILGTPAFYINPLKACNCDDLESSYDLCYNYSSTEGLLAKIEELLILKSLKKEHIRKRDLMLQDKINVTDFLVWFIENYPESHAKMKDDPNFQNQFI